MKLEKKISKEFAIQLPNILKTKTNHELQHYLGGFEVDIRYIITCHKSKKKRKKTYNDAMIKNYTVINDAWKFVNEITELHKEIKRNELTRDDYYKFLYYVNKDRASTKVSSKRVTQLIRLREKLVRLLRSNKPTISAEEKRKEARNKAIKDCSDAIDKAITKSTL